MAERASSSLRARIGTSAAPPAPVKAESPVSGLLQAVMAEASSSAEQLVMRRRGRGFGIMEGEASLPERPAKKQDTGIDKDRELLPGGRVSPPIDQAQSASRLEARLAKARQNINAQSEIVKRADEAYNKALAEQKTAQAALKEADKKVEAADRARKAARTRMDALHQEKKQTEDLKAERAALAKRLQEIDDALEGGG